jgi:hypothetical protein
MLPAELISDKFVLKWKGASSCNELAPPGPSFEECLHSRSAGPAFSPVLDTAAELSVLPKLPLAGCLFHLVSPWFWIIPSVSIKTLGRENERARKHGGFQCN